MSMRTISPLRQSMIDDMMARLGSANAAGLYSQLQTLLFLGRSPETATADDIRRFQLDCRERAQHLQPQQHCDRGEVPVPGDAAPAGSGYRVLSMYASQ